MVVELNSAAILLSVVLACEPNHGGVTNFVSAQ